MLNKFIISLFIFSIFSLPAICFAGDNTIFNAFFRMNSFDPGSMPSPPILTKFDERVLKLCGDWGNKPTQDEFVAMLTEPESQGVVNDIYNALEHTVITPNTDIDTFVAELSQVWFHKNGFTHIFCGDPKKNRLGGLHFVGRIYEAEKKQWAGVDSEVYKESSEHDAFFATGIEFLDLRGAKKRKNASSFDKDLHADDILTYATLAFKMVKEKQKDKIFCNYNLNGYTGIGVFLKNQNDKAIITFYPNLPISPLIIPKTPDAYYSAEEYIETDSGQIAGAEVNELPGDDFYEKLKILMEQAEKK
ncbi:EndoU domain-containing protein [Candidatus Mesenet endosymbiont of Agriotes lineatus]|uniref:EndoU domain-containing protein n=1 Tax=Candidatus Mesenet endosymbiont of Agriotes lineatus TaxID=3077948 RepID=UPI0030CEEFA9